MVNLFVNILFSQFTQSQVFAFSEIFEAELHVLSIEFTQSQVFLFFRTLVIYGDATQVSEYFL